jgi:hypothetical protein
MAGLMKKGAHIKVEVRSRRLSIKYRGDDMNVGCVSVDMLNSNIGSIKVTKSFLYLQGSFK